MQSRRLHCTALHCTALHCTALHHSTPLHYTARNAAQVPVRVRRGSQARVGTAGPGAGGAGPGLGYRGKRRKRLREAAGGPLCGARAARSGRPLAVPARRRALRRRTGRLCPLSFRRAGFRSLTRAARITQSTGATAIEHFSSRELEACPR